jgi:light-regulated signal transduction histidine kinase (bacteriophytochrome)
MTLRQRALLDEYSAVLESHLAKPSEAGLHHAFEIGRQAVSDNLGVLDMAVLYHHALGQIAAHDGHLDSPLYLDKAGEFFAESLSPFEMLLRGFRESNARLTEANSELRQAKAQTEAVNKELEAFSYSVAHDLRAPLRSIEGFSQALAEDWADRLEGEGLRYLEYIRESAKEMSQLIDGLLSLSRVTTQDLHHERIDLTRMAQAIVGQLRRLQPERQVETVIAEGLAVGGDTRLLRVTLDNLIGNAWKYTAQQSRPRIEFGSAAEGEETVYFVRDNGAGFDMAHAGKLFGVFQRLHAAGEFEGTGVGLATVKRIVQRHGGRIWADAEVGKGATFYFTLGADGASVN